MKKLSNKHKNTLWQVNFVLFHHSVFMECSQVLGSSAGVNVI